MADDYGLSPQDKADLQQIRQHLPAGDPRHAKLDTLLGPTPTGPTMQATPDSRNAFQKFVDNLSTRLPGDRRGHSPSVNVPADFGAHVIGSTLGILAHPIAAARSVSPEIDPTTGRPTTTGMIEGLLGPGAAPVVNMTKGAYQEFKGKPLSESVPSFAGDLVGGELTGEALRGVTNGVRGVPDASIGALRRLTKTTPNDTGEFVAKTAKDNADSVKSAADKTGVNKERVDDLNARRNEVYQTRKAAVEEKNKAAAEQFAAKQAEQQGKLAADRTAWAEKEHGVRQAERAAQEVGAKKEVITRAQGEYARLALDNLKKAKEAANTALNARWNSLRAKMERPSITDKGIDMRPVKVAPIVDAIENARTKYLVGSPEDLKAFNDLMGRIESGDVVDTSSGVKPMAQNLGWSEARTHFSNIADKMYSGNLPGNVWKALREVHDALDTQLKGAAKARGLEGEYSSLKNDWSQYKDDFDDLSSVRTAGGSPLAQVVRAQIPADLESVLKGKYGDLLLERTAKYRNRGANPDILNRYRQLGKKAEALESPRVPQRTAPLKDGQVSNAPSPKPLPQQPPPLTAKPVTPDVRVVRPQDVQQFKADRVLDKADKVRSSSGHIATFIAVLDGLRGIFSGNPGEVALDVAGRTGYAVGKEQFARMLEHRSVVNALSNLTPEDVNQVMRLPPTQRAGFTELAKAAQAKGVKIPPAAAAALGISMSVGTYPQVAAKLQGATQ